MPAWWIPAAIEGGKFLYGLFNKPEKFSRTPYGERLKQIATTGAISPKEQSSIMGNVGRTTGSAAQSAKVGFSGRLASMGMGQSIAGQEKLADIDAQRIQQLSDVTERIGLLNARSKEQARTQLAFGETQSDEERRSYDQQLINNLLGGAERAGMGYYESRMSPQNRIPELIKLYENNEIGENQFEMELTKLGLSVQDIKDLYKLSARQ
jgi:hypothetical protein